MDKTLVNESTIMTEVRFIGLTLTSDVLGRKLIFFVCYTKKKKRFLYQVRRKRCLIQMFKALKNVNEDWQTNKTNYNKHRQNVKVA